MNITFTIFEVILVVVITIGFVGYVITTNHIIKSQEKEINELNAELTKCKRSIHHRDVTFGDF